MAKKPTPKKKAKASSPKKKVKKTDSKFIVARIGKDANNGEEYFDYLSDHTTNKQDLIDILEDLEDELEEGDIIYEMVPIYVISKGTIHVTPYERK